MEGKKPEAAIAATEGLIVNITGGRLVISIGIRTLATAIELSPKLKGYDPQRGRYYGPQVTDPQAFAHELTSALRREINESGETLITQIIDMAALNAVEAGAPGIDYPVYDTY